MVGHQDVGVEPKPVALAIVLDAFKISVSVLVVLKGSLPLIAANNHMIKCTVKFDSGLACHGAKVARKKTLSQYSGLTPILTPDP